MDAPKLERSAEHLTRLTREDCAVVAFMAEHDFSAEAYDELCVGDAMDAVLIRASLGRARAAVRAGTYNC